MTKPDYLEILFVLKELGKWAKKMRKDYSFLNLLKNGSYGSILCLLLLQIFVKDCYPQSNPHRSEIMVFKR